MVQQIQQFKLKSSFFQANMQAHAEFAFFETHCRTDKLAPVLLYNVMQSIE